MKRKRFSEEQIAFALRQAEAGSSVGEVCRKLGISESTFYRWKKHFAGMGVPEIRRLKQLEEENRRLKQLVADLTLDKTCCRTSCAENGDALSPPEGRGALAVIPPGQRTSGVPGYRLPPLESALPAR